MRFFKVCLLFGFLLFLAACGGNDSDLRVARVGGGFWPYPGFGGNLTGAQVGDPGFYIYQSLFVNIRGTDEIIPMLAVSAEHTANTTIVHLRDDVYWNDGVKFTAQDIWTYYYLMNFESSLTFHLLDFVVLDDYSFELILSDPVPSELARQIMITGDWNAVTPYHIFGEFAHRAYEILQSVPLATGDATPGTFGRDLENPDFGLQRSQLRRNVNDYKGVSLDRPIGTGPFMVYRVTNSEMILTQNPYFYDRESLQYDRIHMINVSDFSSLLASNGLDSFVGTLPLDMTRSILDQSGQMVVYLIQETRTVGVLFNHSRDHFSDVQFRQALNFVLDRRNIREVGNYWAVETMFADTGILPSSVERYVSPEVIAKMTVYNTDHARASAMLEELGWTRQGNNWVDPSGNVPSFVIAANAGWGSQGINIAVEVARQLTAFGMPTEAIAVDATVVLESMRDGQFDMLVDFMNQTWNITDPMINLTSSFNTVAENSSLDGNMFNLRDWNGNEIIYVGEHFTTTSARNLVNRLRFIESEEDRQELVDRIVWSLNEFAMAASLFQSVMAIWENAETQEGLPMEHLITPTNRIMPLPQNAQEFRDIAVLNREFAHHGLRFIEGNIRPRVENPEE